MDSIKTMQAVPTIPPSTVRKVRDLRLLKLINASLNKSGVLMIFRFLLFAFQGVPDAEDCANHRAEDDNGYPPLALRLRLFFLSLIHI